MEKLVHTIFYSIFQTRRSVSKKEKFFIVTLTLLTAVIYSVVLVGYMD